MMSPEIWTAVQSIVKELAPLAAVGLGWLLGTQGSRRQRKLDAMEHRFAAFRELMKVAANVPPDLSGPALFEKLAADPDLSRNLQGRFMELLGLRTELLPHLEQDVRRFIDRRFIPLFVIVAGSADPRPESLPAFATMAVEFRDLVAAIEERLVSEHARLWR